MKRSIALLMLLMFFLGGYAQENQEKRSNDRGSVYATAGSMLLFYHQWSIGYETKDFLSKNAKHAIHANIGVGASYFHIYTDLDPDILFQSNLSLVYLYGTNQHHFEVNGGAVVHTVLGIWPKSFLGYRCQKPEGQTYFKIGVGFIELLQVGFGVRL